MKYGLTNTGKRQASLLIRQKNTYYSISNKILTTLLSGINYDIDSLYSLLSGDISIKYKMSLDMIARNIKLLIDDGYLTQVDERPIMPSDKGV